MKRDNSIDIWRGVAVVFMVASHAAWFFALPETPVWQDLRMIGDAICFVTFLLTFGIAQYFSLFAKQNTPELISKSFNRTLKLVLAYYIAAFFCLLPNLVSGTLSIELILKTLLFINVPGFVEFLMPFIIFSFVFTLIKKYNFFEQIFRNNNYVLLLIVLGLAFFIVGQVLFSAISGINLNDSLRNLLSLISGHSEVYLRYPILQYAIVPLFGLGIGKMILDNEREIVTKSLILQFFVLTTTTIIAYLIGLLWSTNWLNEYHRFPPSLLFIIQNLSITILFGVIIRWTVDLALWNPLKSYGINALGIMVSHIIVLRILESLNFPKTANSLVILLCFLMALHALYLYILVKKLILKPKD